MNQSLQKDFDTLVRLLKKQEQAKEMIAELLFLCSHGEITYSTCTERSQGTNKTHLLEIYRTRAGFEETRKDNPFVFGYEALLPSLEQAPFDSICISSIHSGTGTYLVFTDENKSALIGILKTLRTLAEVREGYASHKKAVKASGTESLYDYEANEVVFLDGKLKK